MNNRHIVMTSHVTLSSSCPRVAKQFEIISDTLMKKNILKRFNINFQNTKTKRMEVWFLSIYCVKNVMTNIY